MADAAKRAREGGFIDILSLGLLALGGGIVAAHIVHPNYAKIAALLGRPWTTDIVASAWKWSRKRGVPFAWVLATIIVESGADPHSAGDAGGKSKGLMQVNVLAHAADLMKAGYVPNDMYKIDPGIEMGTLAMRDIYNKYVLEPSAARPTAAPKDVAMRLAYKGPATVKSAILRGEDPRAISWAPEAISRWRAATQRVATATGNGPVNLPFV